MRGAYVVMGVSGCGKSSVARLLAERTAGLYLDADDFHPPANKAKMSASIPLTEEDRLPWLDTLNQALTEHGQAEQPLFLACSALRESYRQRLSIGLPELRFIYLKGSKELISQRMKSRKDHFMPATLLDGQFAVLEEPTDAVVVSIDAPLPNITNIILPQLLRRCAER